MRQYLDSKGLQYLDIPWAITPAILQAIPQGYPTRLSTLAIPTGYHPVLALQAISWANPLNYHSDLTLQANPMG